MTTEGSKVFGLRSLAFGLWLLVLGLRLKDIIGPMSFDICHSLF